MKNLFKQFLFLCLFLTGINVVFAQNLDGTDPAFEIFYKDVIVKGINTCTSEYKIPVVFHDLAEQGNASITFTTSELQVHLDKASKLFQDNGINIKLVLAEKDPMGNPSQKIYHYLIPPGTDVKSASTAYGLIHNPAYSPINSNAPNLHWECDYLNIYIYRTSTTQGAAFSSLPKSALKCEDNGILAIPGIFEVFPPNSAHLTIAHETGHFLGLLHPWGGNTAPSCIPGDYVDDTDPINLVNNKCNDLNCGGSVTNTSDNIMSYAYTCSPNKFTPKQITRMCTALKYFCSRRNLWSNENLVKTGLLTAMPTITQLMQNPTITQTTTWAANVNIGSTLTIDGTLTIESGATLNIEGATVKFCNQCGSTTNRGKIFIKKGGTLNIDKTTLTNGCDIAWEGIEMEGSFDNFARFTAKNVSVISNAIIGVKNYTTFKYSGAFVSCDDLSFKNCRTSVDLTGIVIKQTKPDDKPSTTTYYHTSFNKCIFTFNDDGTAPNYNTLNLTSNFLQFAKLTSAVAQFVGCDFTYTLTSASPDYASKQKITELGYGINSKNSHFKADACKFYGLGFGIHAKSTSSTGSFICNNISTFEKCAFGIYSSLVVAPYIDGNTFSLGEVSKPLPSLANAIGVMLDGNSMGFKVLGNTFKKSETAQVNTVGLICNNTGSVAGKVKKNVYDGLFHANIANGENGAKSKGLVYECNTHSGISSIGYNIANVDAPIITPNPFTLASTANINSIQASGTGSIENPGNTFSGTNPSTGNFKSDQSIDYYNYESSKELTQFYSPFSISLKKATKNNTDCPKIKNKLGECPPPCLTNTDIRIITDEYTDTKISCYIPTKLTYDTRLDGGITEHWIEIVRNVAPEQSDEVFHNLQTLSPWLSSQVLYNVIDKVNIFGNENVYELLRNNPHVVNSERLYNYLLNLDTPFSEEQIHALQEGNDVADNERLDLERRINICKTNMNSLGNDILQTLVAEEDPKHEDIRYWMNELENHEFAIDDYLSTQNYAEARNELENIEDVDYRTVKALQINHLEQDEDFSNANLDNFVNYAYQGSKNAKLLARHILAENGLFFEPEYYLPQEGASTRGLSSKVQQFKKAKLDVVVLYPNPADELLNLEYKLPKQILNAQFDLRDAFGRVAISQKLQGTNGQHTFDITRLQDGLYFFSISTKDGDVLQSGRLIISKL